jgi:hypothetical protein
VAVVLDRAEPGAEAPCGQGHLLGDRRRLTGREVPQDLVVLGPQQPQGGGVGQHELTAHRHRRPATSPADRPQVVVEEQPFVQRTGRQQLVADRRGRGHDQRQHPRVRVAEAAAHVDHAGEAPTERVEDRRPGTAEATEHAGVVLGAGHQRREPPLQHGADAVGADHLLGEQRARHAADRVEGPGQTTFTGVAFEDLAPPVAEDHTGGGSVELADQPVDHRRGGPRQRGVTTLLALRDVHPPIGGHPAERATPPRFRDLRTDPGGLAFEHPAALAPQPLLACHRALPPETRWSGPRCAFPAPGATESARRCPRPVSH